MDYVDELTNEIITKLLIASKHNLDKPFTFKIPKETESFLYYWQGCGSNIITWIDKNAPKGDNISFVKMKEYLDNGTYVKITNKK